MLDLNLNHIFVTKLMTAYELKNIAILNVKGVDFRCVLWEISRDEANRTPIEVIREGAFGGTFFRDIYPCVTGKWY